MMGSNDVDIQEIMSSAFDKEIKFQEGCLEESSKKLNDGWETKNLDEIHRWKREKGIRLRIICSLKNVRMEIEEKSREG